MAMNNILLFTSLLSLSWPGMLSVSVARRPLQVRQMTIQMKGYSPTIDDDYVAISMPAEPGYIVRFEPFAKADRVHHILLYGCDSPAADTVFWKGVQTCRNVAHILYAWARNAPDLRLPEGVAFGVGHESDSIRYFVLQVHYAHPFVGKIMDYSGVTIHMIDDRPAYLAAVLLFVSGSPILPGYAHYQTNMSCTYRGNTPIHPFAFRTHTHSMGRVVSAFYKHDGAWTMIGKRNPQWPQLFQMINTNISIESGDLMAATCVYDSSQQKQIVNMGNMGSNEMCNFYMMFYWDATVPDPFPYGAVCPTIEEGDTVNREYPAEGVSLLPPHPEWEHTAHQSGRPFGISEGFSTRTVGGLPLGQVTSLAFDPYGNLVVFHRGSRVWDQGSFDYANNLQTRDAIDEEVILVTRPDGIPGTTLTMIGKYGKNQFYMPHGLYIDRNNDYYTTDVGSHQVIRWTLTDGKLQQIFALGEKFTPGSDTSHFCKPAGIVVTLDGSIYVADGYCNSRVIKFDNTGKYLAEWGQPLYNSRGPTGTATLGMFTVPHDISANDDGSLLYVTDRENARIQIFRDSGLPVGQVANPNNVTAFTNIYSAHYHDGSVFFIPGETSYGLPLRAFSAHADAARVQFSFEPTSYKFKRPHVIRASQDGQYIYVGELGEDDGKGRILQFILHSETTVTPPTSSKGVAISTSNQSSNFAADTVSTASSSFATLVAIFTLASLFVTMLFCIYRRRQFHRIGPQHSILDRAGFKPLRTDNPSSDEDSDDDTILSRKRLDHRF